MTLYNIFLTFYCLQLPPNFTIYNFPIPTFTWKENEQKSSAICEFSKGDWERYEGAKRMEGGRGSMCLKTKFRTGSVEVLLFSYPLVPVRIKIRKEKKRRVRNWPLIKFSKGNSSPSWGSGSMEERHGAEAPFSLTLQSQPTTMPVANQFYLPNRRPTSI